MNGAARQRRPRIAAGAPIAFLAVTLSLAACHGSGRESDPRPLDQVVAWGAQRLSQTPDSAVAHPSRADRHEQTPSASGGALRKAGQGVISLLDRFDAASVDASWEAPRIPPTLAVVDVANDTDRHKVSGFTRRRPGGNVFKGQRLFGFSVDAAQVGAIDLDLDVGGARELVLTWSRVASITVPVRPEQHHLRIPTDGLSDWGGVINWIAVAVPADLAGELKVRSLRLLPRSEAFSAVAGRRKIQLRDQLRDAIYVHLPATIRWPEVPRPEGARLSLALGTPGNDAVSAAVVVGGTTIGAIENVDGAGGWKETGLELPPGGLELSLSGPPGAVACIANPTIYVPRKNPRRVLLYLIDTFGAKHSNLYGYSRETSPNLAGLAAGGVLFSNAFANGSRTVESVTTLMSGLPAASHGVIHSFARVAPGIPLLAERFSDEGFATMAFSTNINAGPRQGLDRGFDVLIDRMSFYWNDDDARTVDKDAVLGWLEQHRDRDVFLYIHTAEPHAPYAAPSGFDRFFDPSYEGRFNGRQTDPAFGFPKAHLPRDVEHVVALYDEEVRFADHQLGALLAGMERLVGPGTIVAVTADHGEEFREHGQFTHGANLYSETVRVPLVVSAPGLSARRVAEPVQLMDVGWTLLELAGMPADGNRWSRSLVDLSKGGAAAAQRPIVASTYQPQPPHHSLLRTPWRLIFAPGRDPSEAPFRLFDVTADPGETHDRLTAQPEVAKTMIRELVELYESEPKAGRSESVEIDPAQLERLRALGYER